MKTPMKTTLAFFALALSTLADTPIVTGKWKVAISVSGHESETICSLAQNDASIAGTCTTDKGPAQVSGKVDGDKLTWSYKSEYEGSPLTVKYTGAMTSPDLIKGSVDVPEFGATGDFTASRAE